MPVFRFQVFLVLLRIAGVMITVVAYEWGFCSEGRFKTAFLLVPVSSHLPQRLFSKSLQSFCRSEEGRFGRLADRVVRVEPEYPFEERDCSRISEFTCLPHDDFIASKARRVFTFGFFSNLGQESQDVLACRLIVRRFQEYLSELTYINGSDGNRVSVRATMGVIGTVGPERTLDWEVSDAASSRYVLVGAFVSCFSLISLIVPTRSATVGSSVGHDRLLV